MKKNLILIAMTLILSTWVAFPAAAADVTAAMDINSAYVWRGLTFNDGMVIQPSIDVAKGGFGVNVWGNLDVDDYDGALDDGEFSEIDLTLSYSHSFDSFDLSVGYIEYLFPAGGAGTREAYISFGMGLPADLSLALDYYYDFDEVEDFYSVLSLSYGYDMTDQLSLEAGASIAYAGDEYCGDGDAGFYDYTLSLSFGYAVSDALGLSLSLTYVGNIDDEKLVDVDDNGLYDVDFLFGVGISYAF